MMSTPILTRNAIIKKDSTEIGYLQGFTFGVDVDPIKEFKIGSDKPAVLEAGNKSYPWKADRMYIDKTWATLITNGTKFSLVILPSGSGDTYTISNNIVKKWEAVTRQTGVILEGVSGEGMDISLPT